jgi:cbb3-type cytochrome oxidase maturation protein
MTVLTYLIPISLVLGGMGLLFFIFTVRSNQYDDPEGDAQRILSGEYDDRPKQDRPTQD